MDPGHQHFCTLNAHFAAVQVHSCEGGIEILGNRDIIDADHLDIFGYTQTLFAEGKKRACCDQVVATQDPIDTPAREKARDSMESCFGTKIALLVYEICTDLPATVF